MATADLKPKMTRIDMRLTAEQKETFEHASRLAGFKSLTEFILQAVREKADAEFERQRLIELTVRDREVFYEALLNPAEPNTALIEAGKRHQKRAEK